MAELTIDYLHIVDGAQTAPAATPVLRDADNTYGIKRLDTGAIIVAAGTAMTIDPDNAAHFTHVIEDAEPEVRYAYVIEVLTVGFDEPDRFPGELEAALTSAVLPSYLTLDQAEALAGATFGMSAWGDATNADKLKALQTATSRVDDSRRWQGRKYNLDEDGETIEQELEFPRMDGCKPIDVDPSDPTSQVPVVPAKIKLATLWEADSILAGVRRDRVAAQHDGLSGQSIGSASESYRPPVDGQGVPVLCVEADMLCRRYALRTGRLL